ncbi:MAG: restriction endonuclease subunit S [Pseudomonadota bacterium]
MTDASQLITDHLDIWSSAIEKKSGTGRGNSGPISLYGIKKLRELILELAVQGKLVPQDPTEGNSNDLLETIEQSRRDLVKQKKVKNKKVSSPVAEEEFRFLLPNGWAWTRLSAMAEISPRNDVEDSTVVSFVPMPDIQTSHTGEHHHSERRWGEIKKSYTHFADGDIALAKITPCFENSKAAVFSNLYNGVGAGTTELHVARPYSKEIVPGLILLHLKAPSFLENGKAVMTGSAGQKRVPRWYFADTPIALPPTAEQHRILAKVDELMGLCDTLEAQAEDGLKAHQTLVETCLAALTNSQTPEDLAQNWARLETNFDALFTTEESIQLLEDAVQELAVAGVLVEQDPSEDRANQSLLRPDASAEKFDLTAYEARSKLFHLPDGWTIEPLSRVSSHIVDCPHTTPKWTEEGELCVKSEQIFAGKIDLSKPKFVSHETYIERIERLTPQSDDILYKREGGILGVGSRIPPNTKICMGQRLMLIRAGGPVRADFLELVINSHWTRRFAAEKTTGGAAPRVNMTVVRAYPIPIPPMNEQARIVDRAHKLSDLCRELRARVRTELGLRTALADTLVESAA